MSEKRMFSRSVVLSDAFLDMPPTARCLYFTLSMLADDDGFVDAPRSIMRQSGASEDDMRILLAKCFLIPFETGIVVIRHWRINNYLRCDRYKETRYLDEKSQLVINKDASYEKRQRSEQEAAVRIPLIEREPKNDLERVEKTYLLNYKELFDAGLLRMDKPVINWNACRKLERECIGKYGVDTLIEAVNKSRENNFVVRNGYVLTTILSAGILAQLINTVDECIDKDYVHVEEVSF